FYNLFELQIFIALLAITSLIIAGVIGEQRTTESELQRSRKQHRDIVHYSSVGIFQSTPDGVIVLANPALARILGYAEPEQLIGRSVTEAVYWDVNQRPGLVSRVEALVEGAELEMQWKRAD